MAFKQIWFVSYDKQKDPEPIYLNRERIGESFDEAVSFSTTMRQKGFRTMIWWQYESEPDAASIPKAPRIPRDYKRQQIEQGNWSDNFAQVLLIAVLFFSFAVVISYYIFKFLVEIGA